MFVLFLMIAFIFHRDKDPPDSISVGSVVNVDSEDESWSINSHESESLKDDFTASITVESTPIDSISGGSDVNLDSEDESWSINSYESSESFVDVFSCENDPSDSILGERVDLVMNSDSEDVTFVYSQNPSAPDFQTLEELSEWHVNSGSKLIVKFHVSFKIEFGRMFNLKLRRGMMKCRRNSLDYIRASWGTYDCF